jgi:chemotaxis protein MotB
MGARRKRHEEHESHERWLVSYADFITLLFAFFAVLYATSQADLQKQEEFQESIKKSFAPTFGFNAGSANDDFSNPRNTSLIKPPFETFPPAGSATQEVQDYVEHKLDKEMSEKEKKETIGGIRHDAVGVRIQVAANRLFDTGSADLAAESGAALDKIGRLLKTSGRRLIIEGHTDDEPIRTDKYPSNWELSAARATKIVRYLIAKHKVSASQLTAVAYGDQKPVVPNDSPENRARNRRIEILIVTSPKETAP